MMGSMAQKSLYEDRAEAREASYDGLWYDGLVVESGIMGIREILFQTFLANILHTVKTCKSHNNLAQMITGCLPKWI